MKLTKRKEQAQKTKSLLFYNAVKKFQEKGYDNVTVEEICKASGVSKGTFYVHFNTKEDIIRTSYHSQFDDYLHQHFLSFIENNPHAGVREKLKNQMLAALNFCNVTGVELTTRAFMYNLSVQLHDRKMEQYIQNSFQETFEGNFTGLIQDGIDDDLFQSNLSGQDIYLMITAFLCGCMITWCYCGGRYNIVTENQSALQLLVDNLFFSDK